MKTGTALVVATMVVAATVLVAVMLVGAQKKTHCVTHHVAATTGYYGGREAYDYQTCRKY